MNTEIDNITIENHKNIIINNKNQSKKEDKYKKEKEYEIINPNNNNNNQLNKIKLPPEKTLTQLIQKGQSF